ncbi:MAG: hypothetical protein RML93_12615 [Anaerolineales bacterium]|nr:hypothetical protein [Anaerolineales bacterium]MDW8448117.1 hypothetical protein [Anaerolineales bacterium]
MSRKEGLAEAKETSDQESLIGSEVALWRFGHFDSAAANSVDKVCRKDSVCCSQSGVVFHLDGM